MTHFSSTPMMDSSSTPRKSHTTSSSTAMEDTPTGASVASTPFPLASQDFKSPGPPSPQQFSSPRCIERGCVFNAAPGPLGLCFEHTRRIQEPQSFESTQPTRMALQMAIFGPLAYDRRVAGVPYSQAEEDLEDYRAGGM